jgi:putative addiction module killer protein
MIFLVEILSFISYNNNMSRKRSLKVYQDSNGKEPFIEWLESIKDRKTRSRIITRLDRLEVGNPGDYRHVEEGVFELRLHFGPGYRIYYGEDGPVIVILLMGGDKSSQSKDIKEALSFWKKYKEA